MNGQSINGEPLVSILVVSYNQKEYIQQTIDSLLFQDCPFIYEILIGEDCSTDGTREICIEYERNYPDKIRLFLNKENKGFINNYFDLFEYIRGKYIADCGGDDYWLSPQKLRSQVQILENHPDVSLVYCNWQMFYQKNGLYQLNMAGRSEDWYDSGCFGKDAMKNYINGFNIPRVVLSSACFRTDWLKNSMVQHKELFFGKGIVCEDLPITMSLLEKGPFYMMMDDMMVYRVLEESVSHNKNKDNYMKGFAWSAFQQTVNIGYKLGLSSKDIEPYISRIFPDFVLQAFITGDKKWMNIIKKTSGEFGIQFRLKQKILSICLHNRFLEVLGRFIYNALKH